MELREVESKLERLVESATWEGQQSHLLNISCWEEVNRHQQNVQAHEQKLAQAAAQMAEVGFLPCLLERREDFPRKKSCAEWLCMYRSWLRLVLIA